MSIAARVTDAIDKMESTDPAGALFAICAAIEATANKESQTHGRSAYKKFLHSNLDLITAVAFGGKKILNINLAYAHPDVPTNADGLCSIQDIIYHAVRCGLYHDAKLPDDLSFTNEGSFRIENKKLVMPSSLVYGLIIAVVVSPTNANEIAQKPSILNLGNFHVPISKLWGRKTELLWLLDAFVELCEMEAKGFRSSP